MRNLLVVLKNGVGMGCYIYIYIYIERWGTFFPGVGLEAVGFSDDAFDEGILNFGWFPWRWFPIENSRPASNFVTRVRVLKKKKFACSTELRLIIESTLCQKRTLYCPSFSSGIKRTALLRREVRHTSDLETENRKVKSGKWKVPKIVSFEATEMNLTVLETSERSESIDVIETWRKQSLTSAPAL